MLSLEPINEPPSNTEADAAEINKLNEIFLKALADSGGFNSQRVVTLVGPNMDGGKTSQYFKAPKNVTNPWALQFHYYSPCKSDVCQLRYVTSFRRLTSMQTHSSSAHGQW